MQLTFLNGETFNMNTKNSLFYKIYIKNKNKIQAKAKPVTSVSLQMMMPV